MNKLYEKIKSVLNIIRRVLINKKTLILIFGITVAIYVFKKQPKEVLSNQFFNCLNENQIQSLMTYDKNFVTFNLKNSNKNYYSYILIEDIDKFNANLIRKNINFKNLSNFMALINNPLNQLQIILFSIGFMSINFVMDITKSKNLKKENNNNDFNKIFSDFIAKKETLDSLNLIIKQIDKSKMEKKIKPIKGILLYGSPGTGKTLIARCLEKMSNVNFISSSASEFVEIYVGSGAKKVREIFEKARNSRPAIIFIDELEAIGLQRSQNINNYTNNVERFSTLNQLLSEMDGLNDMENIIVIGATNRQDLIDAALIRPGRFDMKIHIDNPDADVRYRMYKHYLSKFEVGLDITDDIIKDVSNNSINFSGAIIESVVNDAARLSYTHDNTYILKEYFLNSFEKHKSEYQMFKEYEIENNK